MSWRLRSRCCSDLRREVSENLRQQLTSQSEYLGSLIRDYDIWSGTSCCRLSWRWTGTFRRFRNSGSSSWSVFYGPGAFLLFQDDWTELPGAIADLADPDQWKQTGRILIADAKAGPLPVTLGLMLLVVVWVAAIHATVMHDSPAGKARPRTVLH